jgi:hypothetical protein
MTDDKLITSEEIACEEKIIADKTALKESWSKGDDLHFYGGFNFCTV